MKRWNHWVAVIGATCVAGALGTTAKADAYDPYLGRDVVVERPNTDAIVSGIFTIGMPYIASVAVASQSDHPGDNQLYYPVAGPWLDLARRGDCGGPGQTTCDNETFYKAALIGDGVIQGIGALEILGGLLFPERRTIHVADDATKPRVSVSPTSFGGRGVGMGAAGRF
jgi:hypothetical protein